MIAVGTAINSELMLHRHDVYIVDVQHARGSSVIAFLGGPKLEIHLGRIVIAFGDVVHGHHQRIHALVSTHKGIMHVLGECGDAALAGHVRADQGDAMHLRRTCNLLACCHLSTSPIIAMRSDA